MGVCIYQVRFTLLGGDLESLVDRFFVYKCLQKYVAILGFFCRWKGI